jgi:hypothetical protein
VSDDRDGDGDGNGDPAEDDGGNGIDPGDPRPPGAAGRDDGDPGREGDPGVDAGSGSDPDRGPGVETGAGGREGPLADLADEVDSRRGREGVDLPEDELFDESDVEGVDREALWRQVADDSVADRVASDAADPEGPVEVDTGPDPGPGPTVERPDDGRASGAPTDEAREERVVDKGKYCRNCEYFSAPPEVRCTHEGTEIAEEVDMDHFRVVNCPVVREDEELENV